MDKKPGLSKFCLALSIAAVFFYIAWLQFLSPAFSDPDSYYHIAVSHFIKNFGINYKFGWMEFSTFKTAFSDKDFLFHALNLPFMLLTDNPVAAGKYAFLFEALLFILIYAFVLKKYLPHSLTAVFLLLIFSSATFTAYFLQLRSATLANSLAILGIYCLINKKPKGVFIFSFLYSLSHISFLTMIVFAVTCEILRRILNKEFFAKNIYYCLAGIIIGCLLHPNFPNNLFSLYLNGIIVPLCGLTGKNLGFGSEMQAFDMRHTFINNSALFLSLNFILWLALIIRRKTSLSTAVWLASTSIFIFLGFFGNRYWYQANALFFIFFASCVNDWRENSSGKIMFNKIAPAISLFLILIAGFFVINLAQLKAELGFSSSRSSNFENIGNWMGNNIPKDKIIYHSYWNDAPYFLCLNPKDRYINCLDPVYMHYPYPREYELLNELSLGRVDKPFTAIGKIFKAEYAYINKFEPLYRQVKDYPQNFQLLYENSQGAVFKVTAG